MNRTALLAPVVAGVLILAACSGDDDGATPTTSPATTADDEPIVTSEKTQPSTTAAASTSTTVEEFNRMPLTGSILGDDQEPPPRPALAVKVDNVPDAWPQYGLNTADIVFEEIINDASTRFAAIYHSQDADRVGPIRSGRLQDIDLLGVLDRPLFAWSGGNATVNEAIAASDMIDLRHGTHQDLYFRDDNHDDTREHTLFSDTAMLWGYKPDVKRVPTPVFDYLAPDEQFDGQPAAGLEVSLDSVQVRWEWNPQEKAYYRLTGGEPHVSIDGGNEAQFSTNNVVVMQMEYVPSPADARSPDAVTVASGPAWVFSNGKVIEGTWTRPKRTAGFTLTTGKGQNKEPIKLPPGRTAVEMPRQMPEGVPTPIPVPGEG